MVNTLLNWKLIKFRNGFLIFLTFICLAEKLEGQISAESNKALNITESIDFTTDRSVYIVTEPIFFKAFYFSELHINELNWSKVLYVELITPDGKPLIQRKFQLNIDGTNGYLILPKDIATGNYYMRAYTKWMRNFSPTHYPYQSIKIINPFTTELLQATVNQMDTMAKFKINNINDSIFEVVTNKNSYGKHENVVITLNNKTQNQLFNQMSVSVVKEGAQGFLNNKLKNIDRISPNLNGLTYIPETRGISFTGKVVNKKDSLPIAFSQICLTVIGSSNEYLSSLTDTEGQFYFSLPDHTGLIEVFIAANTSKVENEPLILVENDFCNQKVELPFLPLTISEEERKLINLLIINSQLTQNFFPIKDSLNLNTNNVKTAFYGEPSFTLNFDDYIAMNDLEDYFKELIPSTKIYKKNQNKRIRIVGEYSELSIFEPLVLVDFVPIFNIKALLTISPKHVKRIEVITKPYIMGNIVYGGIIHVVSGDGNFGGVSLPSTGQFFKVQTFENPNNYQNPKVYNTRVPNTLNCIYWNPNISFGNKKELKLSFETGDSPGKYYVIARGLNSSGIEMVKTYSFEIED
ncbi:MAG: hypothetical protein WCX31_16465 [Salinivirgaceae bacterium]